MSSSDSVIRFGKGVFLGVVLVVGVSFAGCGQAAQPKNGPKEGSTAKTPSVTVSPVKAVNDKTTPKASEPPQAAADKGKDKGAAVVTSPAASSDANKEKPVGSEPSSGAVAKGDADAKRTLDLLTTYYQIQDYDKLKEKPEGGLEALKRKRDEQVAGFERKPVIDGALDFVTMDFKKEEGERYRLRWYFVANSDIKEDWIFKVGFKVDPSHVDMLPEECRKDGRMYARIFPAKSAINTWKKGDHVCLTMVVDLKPIPYNITAGFYQWFKDKPQIFSKPLDLGWKAEIRH